MSLESEYERKLIQEKIALSRKVVQALNDAIDDLSAYLARYSKKFPEDYAKRITYINRMGIKKQLESQLQQLTDNVDRLTTEGVSDSWALAVKKNNILTKSFIGGMSVPVPLATAMFGNNNNALVSYLKNVSQISDRVLSYTGLFQDQIEKYMASGIIQGKGAREIASALLKIALDPTAQFKAMKAMYPDAVIEMPKPGQGVYQSVYKNLLRIARNETNIAYRLSDYEKRQDMPFVVGFQVHLANEHEITDICDAMEGSYPIEFVFCGWHTNCWCYTTDILASKDEFKEWIRNGMPEEGIDSQNAVSRIPLAAERYVLTHQDKFGNSYFYRDNFKEGKPLEIIGGARKDLTPYEIIPKEKGIGQIERITNKANRIR